MNEVLVLIFLCLSMLFGSYVAGIIPLVVTLSAEKLQLVSVLGAGLLVGTSLSVIIPEGVNTLFSSYLESMKQLQGGTTFSSHLDPPHSVIGVALVLGFIFMFLIDQLGVMYTNSYQSLPTTESDSGLMKHVKPKITATLGLVVHAAADGIALGAAATTSHADIEIIVFTAIMLHKAPAAFGLVTFLMHEGLDRNSIRRHLLIFSLSAPTLALITYFGISQSTKETLSTFNATGIAMLFSAGTFLYVATVHVLPEISHSDHTSGPKNLKKAELIALVLGALLPLLLSVEHHH